MNLLWYYIYMIYLINSVYSITKSVTPASVRYECERDKCSFFLQVVTVVLVCCDAKCLESSGSSGSAFLPVQHLTRKPVGSNLTTNFGFKSYHPLCPNPTFCTYKLLYSLKTLSNFVIPTADQFIPLIRNVM